MIDDVIEPQGASEEPPYFSYSAALRVFGSISDLDQVTRNLGLNPTHAHRSGAIRSPHSKPYTQDMWMYEALWASLNHFRSISTHYGLLSEQGRSTFSA